MDSYGTGRGTYVDPDEVETRDQLAEVIDGMLGDFSTGGEQEWENGSLDRFLEALADVCRDRRLDERAAEVATWRAFAGLLCAATGYE